MISQTWMVGRLQTIENACPTNVAFAPTGRLDAMQKRLEGMAQAVDIVRPPLDASLTDEQKARLNAANEKESQNGGSLASCSGQQRHPMAGRPDRKGGPAQPGATGKARWAQDGYGQRC